jgi:hypothetical protein
MGLAISRSIVEAHGGQLSALPNVPHGAVFEFSLPAGERPTVARGGRLSFTANRSRTGAKRSKV